MHYAIIENGVVVGTQYSSRAIIADNVVSCGDNVVYIGYLYSNGVFTAPSDIVTTIPEILSPVEFIIHISDSTGLPLETFTELDVHDNVGVRAKWKLLLIARSIERDSPTTASGLSTMVVNNVITQDQSDVITGQWPTI